MNVRPGLVVVHHETRDVYTVYDVTNADSDRPNFKPTVSYMRADGKKFSRELERFTENSFAVLYDGTRKVSEGEVMRHPVLDLPMRSDVAETEGVETIRAYLGKLLSTLWDEGESFSGKRPFGDSGWEYDLIAVLVDHKLIKGTLDDFGGINTMSDAEEAKGKKLIASAIKDMAAGK